MSASELIIYVNCSELAAPLDEKRVARALSAVAEAEGVTAGEMSVTFLEAAAMAALNEAHLGRPGPTDVIAFNLAEPRAPLGDIYVCPEVARVSAVEFGVELEEELLRLVVHGVLHVFGYDHPEGPERVESEMFRRQEAILARLL
ncbi:MAG: rRNA maturation RNase YbeY [Gemmatimonadota bacterium]|nr:MAG: rRNA maturation RNase YbeY [Gemmatimonadota bacterium]